MLPRLRSALLLVGLLGSAPALAQPPLPPDAAYVRADGDRLVVDGRPIRFWGAIGNFPGPKFEQDGDVYAGQRLTVRRLKDMGFNMVRFWHYRNEDYTKGDRSHRDYVDAFFAECARQGVYIWAAGLGGGAIYEDDLPAAARMIDEPATEQAWMEAIRPLMKEHYWSGKRKAMAAQYELVSVWDPRVEAFVIASMKQRAQHVNQHTGLRYSDDPTNAVWELTNEQWWMGRMMRGQWVTLPEFFRRSLVVKWHEFLAARYADDAGLVKAWGFLLPGESLAQGTVLLAPTASSRKPASFNDTNPAALAAFEGVEREVGRGDFTAARSRDVIEFFTGLLVSHKQRFAAELKTWGRSCALSPLVFDTGIGESIQAQFMQQHADAVSHAAYMEGVYESLDPADRGYPFYTILDQYPRISNDVPWLEHNRTPGKPFLAYETQVGNPNKYRAEFPMRLAALGSIQDWSAVCFHYWTIGKYDFAKDNPFAGPLSHPGSGAYQYDYTFDEVAFAARRTAGEVFKHHHLAPAASPTVFTFGRNALYDPASMDYGRSYGPEGLDNLLTTTYRHGVRLVIDPTRDKDQVQGPVVRMKGFNVPTRIRPTPQIEFDTVRSHLTFDAPGVAAYTGFLARHGDAAVRFESGVVLRDVTFNNPDGSPYPVTDDERYLAFTLVTTDGKPLAQSTAALISLVSTSFNTGLQLDPANKQNTWGKEPVLTTRVGATIEAPALAGMRYRLLDFTMKPLAEGTTPDGKLTIPADQPVFLVELTRP